MPSPGTVPLLLPGYHCLVHPGRWGYGARSPVDVSEFANFEDLSSLVSDAAASLAVDSNVQTGSVNWEIVRTDDRPNTTVLEIVVDLGSTQRTVFAKKFKFHPDRPGLEMRIENRIRRSETVLPVVAKMGEHLGVGVASMVAGDADSHSIVTMGVPGVELGRPWRSSPPWRHRDARRIYEQLGSGIRVIEEASVRTSQASDYVTKDEVHAALARVEPVLGRGEGARVSEAAELALTDFNGRDHVSYFSHGDVNHSNVLVDGERIYLIDFDLAERPVTFDLALLMLRLEMERPRLRSWTDSLAACLTDGYGDRDVRLNPSFQLVRLIKLSRGIANARRSGNRSRMRRFLSSLDSTFKTPGG